MMSQPFDEYQFITPLARKVSSVLYLAQSVREATDKVVFKIFDAIYLDTEQKQKKFLQEIEKLKQLHHPYILPVLDGGIENGQPFLISRYAPMNSLRSRLAPSTSMRMPVDDALQIIVRVGQALAYAHSWNIVHGNIKPENVLFDADNKALLADFTPHSIILSHIPDQSSDAHMLSYLAPEQIVGTVSAESDQYALGCLAYELLSGQVPFTRNASEAPTPLPEHIEGAILKALSINPSERHTSVAAFIEALTARSLKVTISAPMSPVNTPVPEIAMLLETARATSDAMAALAGFVPATQRLPEPAIAVAPASMVPAVASMATVQSVIPEPAMTVSVAAPAHQKRKIWVLLACACVVTLITGCISAYLMFSQKSTQAGPSTTVLQLEATAVPTSVPVTPTVAAKATATPTTASNVSVPAAAISSVSVTPTAIVQKVVPTPTVRPTTAPTPTATPKPTPTPKPKLTPTPKPTATSAPTATPTRAPCKCLLFCCSG